MAAEQTQSQQTGEVEATNERGIKLGGRWLYQSQFRTVPHPEVGRLVRVTLQKDRFIASLGGLDADGTAPDAAEGAMDPADGASPEFEGPPPSPPSPPPATSDVARGPDGPPGGDHPRGTAAPRPVPVPVPVPVRVAHTPTPPPAPEVPAASRTPTKASLKAAAPAAAAHFPSGRPDGTEDGVFETASRFLAWPDPDEA